ncbi:MAG: hypothetical protein EOO90_19915 [Pedobacter sp.]|nr:MAG: hypothetical protein EOO90_19915 [Pedobacter sp.]
MIGALLMSLCLAIVFLSRPNRKRDKVLKNLLRKIKQQFNRRPSSIDLRVHVAMRLGNHENNSDNIINESGPTELNNLSEINSSLAELPDYPIEVAQQYFSQTKDQNPVTENSYQTEVGYLEHIAMNVESEVELSQFVTEDKKTQNLKVALIIESLSNSKKKSQQADEMFNGASRQNQRNVELRPPSDIAELDRINQTKTEISKMVTESSVNVTVATLQEKMDNSIIDIDTTPQPIDYSNIKSMDSTEVPNWAHTYIYGYAELERATHEQKAFYDKFKVKFLTGKWVDLAGNTNYAFILLFDLLKQFNIHKNIRLLEEHMNSVSAFYPKTSSYAKKFLLEKMREIGDQEGLDRLEWTTVNNSRPDYRSWDWKNRYVKKLNLSTEDAKLLDDVYTHSNNFMNIEFCAIEVVKLFISVRKALNKAYETQNLNPHAQFALVLDVVARKQYNYRLNSQNYQYVLGNNTQLIFSFILKYCENRIRELYDYNKKLSFLQSYHQEVVTSIDTHILSFIQDDVDMLLPQVAEPDIDTEIELNSHAPTRWKAKLQVLQNSFDQIGKEAFLLQLKKLLTLNAKNLSRENIYLETSKFLSDVDKQLAFEYFLLYMNQNMVNKKLVLKSMSQAMIKKLFPTTALQLLYYQVSTPLIKRELTIDEALEQIKDFYLPARKKIILNTQAIKQVEHQHSGTVKVLNEYLKDEESTEPVVIDPLPLPEEKAKTTISTGSIVESELYNFNASQNEQALILLFKEKDFIVSSDQIDTLCKRIGAIKGVLINNLNENCYDIIDDILIETDEDNYKINQTYYEQIIKG